MKLSNQELLGLICTARDSAEPVISKELAELFIDLVGKVANQAKWRLYPYKEDMKAHALMTLSRVWMGFDPAKSDNPIAFFIATIHCSFINVISQEQRYRELQPVSLSELY